MTQPPAYDSSPPVCPRHPDHPAYVRCQRCARPVCPQCQRPAPVGIQCVDCVREGAKTIRTAKGVFGGTVSTGRPVVTIGLAAACALAYLAQQAMPEVTGRFGFAPFLAAAEPWRFITAAFLHLPSMPMHIVLNMMALWFLGQYLEPLLGRVRFALLYLISAVGGSVGVLLLATNPSSAADPTDTAWFGGTVGASGAIFGLFAAVLVLNRHLGRSSAGMLATVAINFAFGFIYPGISWQGHAGGFVTGLACAGVLAAFRTPARRPWQFAGLAVVYLVLAGLAVAKYAAVPKVYWDPQIFSAAPARGLQPCNLSPTVDSPVDNVAVGVAHGLDVVGRLGEPVSASSSS